MVELAPISSVGQTDDFGTFPTYTYDLSLGHLFIT